MQQSQRIARKCAAGHAARAPDMLKNCYFQAAARAIVAHCSRQPSVTLMGKCTKIVQNILSEHLLSRQ
ncbi:hypothetical protein L579_4487 [Pantoea sp. AS-PWVM4]|nr:hypothetical protein L579_4487 [Pantoea sp. AS-PWVM4]